MPLPAPLDIDDITLDDSTEILPPGVQAAPSEDIDELAEPAAVVGSPAVGSPEYVAMVERAARAEGALSAVQTRPAPPAGPQRVGWVDPTLSAEQQQFQRETEQLIGPGIRAELARGQALVAQMTLQVADANDLAEMRRQPEWDGDVERAVEALRVPFMQNAGVAFIPREEFLNAVIGKRTRAAKAIGSRPAAVRAANTPAVTPRGEAPATGRPRQVTMTKAVLDRMTPAQVKAYVEGNNLPIFPRR